MLKSNARSRLFLIRGTLPLILVAVLWSNPGQHRFILGLLILILLDMVGGVVQRLWQPRLLDYRFALARDIVYVLAFYVSVLQNPHIPALILFPSVLAEVFVLEGARLFSIGVFVELGLFALRMSTIYHMYHQLHPAWALLICTASVVMGLLGMEIVRLEALQESIQHQQKALKGTLKEMLAITLSQSGIDEGLLEQENIDPILDDICENASQSKGRALGERLAEVVALHEETARMLTAREREVLQLIAQGISYAQIARRLQVSEGTVRAHAAGLMRKAEVHSRQELLTWASRHRLLPAAALRTLL